MRSLAAGCGQERLSTAARDDKRCWAASTQANAGPPEKLSAHEPLRWGGGDDRGCDESHPPRHHGRRAIHCARRYLLAPPLHRHSPLPTSRRVTEGTGRVCGEVRRMAEGSWAEVGFGEAELTD